MRKKRPCPSRGMYRHYSCFATSSAERLFRALGTSLAHSAADCLSRGDYNSIVSLTVDPSAYSDAADFRSDYLVAEMMSKFPNWDLGIDRVAVALEKFVASERVCSDTNHRLKMSYGVASTTTSFASQIYSMRRKIAHLLGPFNWDEAERHFGFGPGSTTSLKRVHGDAYYKFGAFKPHVTRECMALAFTAVLREPRWFAHLSGFTGELSEVSFEALKQAVRPSDIFTITDGNHVTTVPKNAKTDRVIAKEPDLNMYLQKGIGGVIRRRLKRVGVNLNDQSLNQKLAQIGSRDGSLATIDLSAASDTVALRLVEEVLPPDWFAAIELCRSHRGVLPSGERLTYQKVSSMGNGFTFELESLIFWALVQTVLDSSSEVDRRIAVYGDDLIVPTSIYGDVVKLLSFCGFTVNGKKSFSTGPFRESCGKHFFAGNDVTPFYIRESVDNPARMIWLANSIRRHAFNGVWGLDARYYQVWTDVVHSLPKYWQVPRITNSLGDIALIGDFDEVRPKRAPHGFEGYTCLGVIERSSTYVPDDTPFLIKALYEGSKRQYSSRFDSTVLLRDSLSDELVKCGDSKLGVLIAKRRVTYGLVKVHSQQWEDFGPWLHNHGEQEAA